ncbi:Stf0 family sulfotransferase [Symbioplanes lichenis]|uniref:Stf0 family sulfotransferase n=1 Tax=Symbioplanes lichenis TaxID=1629072 RepID=UPI00273949B1|nr:Stf0 family sulfotransferase [Actinoplanes lichenis]
MPFDSYFVCATPRTGSSLLLGLLDSTGVCGRPQSYFRAPDEALWADRWQLTRPYRYPDFVRAARAAGSTPNGVFGAKLMWGTVGEVVDRLGDDLAVVAGEFGRTGFVYLKRHDVLAQAVSWLRAEQTATWFVGGHGEISGNDGGTGREPTFDADAIRRFVDTIEEHNAAWERWFAACGIRPHRVTYEDLEQDMVAVTRGIVDFLGVGGPAAAIVARHRRQADELNRRWIARYRRETSGESF